MGEQTGLNEEVAALARLKIEVDLHLCNKGADMRYEVLKGHYDKERERLSSVVDCLKEKLVLEVVRVRAEEVEKISAEESRKLREEISMKESKLSDVESRLENIDESLGKLLAAQMADKAMGVRKLSLNNWRVWTVEDKCLAFLYLLPILIVLALLCSAVYRMLSAESVDISVELNIAELIGGSLIGLGATLAGGAYAMKTYKEIKAE